MILTHEQAQIAEADVELGRLRDQLEEVALRRARHVDAIAKAPGMSVRRAADALGISPTAVQSAVDRVKAADAAAAEAVGS